MNGFRISGPGGDEPLLHSRWRTAITPKRVLFLWIAATLLAGTSGCKSTPTYSGPPDFVLPVVMKKWAIVPDRIVVAQGKKVELVVSTADVEHGFNVPALAINEPVQPGKPAVIRFLAQAAGTYPMRCSIACGRGHDRMTGTIVVTPPQP